MARRAKPPDPVPKPDPADTDDPSERIRRFLDLLGLTHARAHLDDYLAWAVRERVAPSLLLLRIFGEQAALTRERRIERRIQPSALRERKTLEAFDWNFQPGLDRSVVLELAILDFVRRADVAHSARLPALPHPPRDPHCPRLHSEHCPSPRLLRSPGALFAPLRVGHDPAAVGPLTLYPATVGWISKGAGNGSVRSRR